MTDAELQLFLAWDRSIFSFDELTDEWKAWAKGVILSAKVDTHGKGHIRPEDAVLYLCQIIQMFACLRGDKPDQAIPETDLRVKFISGLVLSGFPPQTDVSYYFQRAMNETQSRGCVTCEEIDLWHPGMASGSGWTSFCQLTVVGKKLADNATIEESSENAQPTNNQEDTAGNLSSDLTENMTGAVRFRFPDECETDDLLKAATIAHHCIMHIESVCGYTWDEQDMWLDVLCIRKHIRILAWLAKEGWRLLPRVANELTLASDNVVSILGVSGTNAHEAALRLADKICVEMESMGTLGLPGDYRDTHLCPDGFLMQVCWKEPTTSDEAQSAYDSYKRNWKRLELGDVNQLSVLEKTREREFCIARNRRTGQTDQSKAATPVSKAVTPAQPDARPEERQESMEAQEKEESKTIPTEAQLALHATILECIAAWRWLLGLERNPTGLQEAEWVQEVWFGLNRLHGAWCDFSKHQSTELGSPSEDIDFLTKRYVGVESITHHHAVGELVGILLKSLEPRLRPIRWRWSRELESMTTPLGWKDGSQEQDSNWWPFFNPHHHQVDIASIFHKLRLDSDRNDDGSSVASHLLNNCWVITEWRNMIAACEPDNAFPRWREDRAMNHPFGRHRQPALSLNLTSPEVTESLKVVEEICVALRDLQRDVRFAVAQHPACGNFTMAWWELGKSIKAKGDTCNNIVSLIAEYQYAWNSFRKTFCVTTRPLIAECAATRTTSLQVGGGLFSSAIEALDTILLEIVCGPTGAPGGWSIPQFIMRVAPSLWVDYGNCKGMFFAHFLRDHYYDGDIAWTVAGKNDIDLESYIQRNVSQPIETQEELWVRVASAPEANFHFASTELYQRYCNILEMTRLRLSDLNIDLLETELRIEHAKLAAERGVRRVSPKADGDRDTLNESETLENAVKAETENQPLYLLQLDGAVYRVQHNGESGTIPAHLKGAKYIFELLQHPHKFHKATDLRGAVLSGDSGKTDEKEFREALKLCNEDLKRIDTDIEGAKRDGDELMEAELVDEREKVLAEVRRCKGLGGKLRLTNLNESARVSVTKSIELVINKCRNDFRLPKFAAHLDDTIDRGTDCAYRPTSPAPDWQF